MERVRPLTELPLIVKLTPNATDPAAVGAAAEAAGADALSLINTLKGMALDPRGGGPWLGGGTGGVSGPAVRAIALEQVSSVAAEGERFPSSGWAGSPQDATRPTSWPPEPAAWPSAPRASAIRPPGGESAPSWPDWRLAPRQVALPSGTGAAQSG